MIFDKFLLGRRRDQLSEDDLLALEHAAAPVKVLPPRSLLVREGDPVSVSTYLIDGFMCRYKDDRQGQRQIVAVHVPGDFVDLHAYPLKRLDHDVATLTTCRVAQIRHARLDDIMAERPGMSKLLWFSTLLDAAMHREWIFRLGRLDALRRLGHFVCEIESKLRAVKLSDGLTFVLPMTQADLAEACGITAVHVNRMARELRERGMLRIQGNQIQILDRDALYRLSEFDAGYLFIDNDGAEH